MLCWTPRDIILVTLRMVLAQSQISRRGDRIPPQILNLIMMHNRKRCREGRQQQGSQGMPSSVRWDRRQERWTVTGRATPRWVEERSGELREVRGGIAGTGKKMVNIHTRTPRKWRMGTGRVKITAIADMWTSSTRDNSRCIGSYPLVGKDAILQRIDKLDDTTGGILEDQAILDNTLKSIGSHQEDYEAKLETLLVQQQGMLDKMIKYLENVEHRMKELERRAGVPAPGPDLPWDTAPESFLRQLTTLRTAAEGVAPMEGPMESAPYSLPRIDPSLVSHIPLFSASVMLGEETPEKGSGIGTPKRDTREGTVEIDMSSPPATGSFNSRVAYERRGC